MEIKERIELTLAEVSDNYKLHETFFDFLAERVEEKIGRQLNYLQIVDYVIIAHDGTTITLEVEGYEEA